MTTVLLSPHSFPSMLCPSATVSCLRINKSAVPSSFPFFPVLFFSQSSRRTKIYFPASATSASVAVTSSVYVQLCHGLAVFSHAKRILQCWQIHFFIRSSYYTAEEDFICILSLTFFLSFFLFRTITDDRS